MFGGAARLQALESEIEVLDSFGRLVKVMGGNSVVAWGSNAYGESTIPEGLHDVDAVAAGIFHTVALKSDGTIHAWGNNSQGQSTSWNGERNIIAIAAGGHTTVALKKDSTLWTRHIQAHFPLIKMSSRYRFKTVMVGHLGDVLAITDTDSVKSWKGIGGINIADLPDGLFEVSSLSVGYGHAVAIRFDGKLITWGELYPYAYDRYGPYVSPPGLGIVKAVCAGSGTTAAIKQDGSVVEWSGNGKMIDVPVDLQGTIALSSGFDHFLALQKDGTVKAWGSNIFRAAEVPPSVVNAVAVAAGGYHSVAIVQNGFGRLPIGQPKSHTIYIQSSGISSLSGVNVQVVGVDADQFRVIHDITSTIPRGTAGSITVQYLPTRIGSANAYLLLNSNDSDRPKIVELKGIGINFQITATKSNPTGGPFTYAPLRLERATGLMLQRVSFTNTTGVSLQGLRLALSNVTSGIALYSNSAGKAPGTFEVLYTKAIAPNETVTFDLVYHDPKRRTTASIQPTIKAQALEETVPTPGPVKGTNVPVLRVQKLPQGPALEWNSKAGSTYVVEYSDDAGKTWSSAVHRLTSRSTRMFWIDRGQPETFSKPVAGKRTYRVKRL